MTRLLNGQAVYVGIRLDQRDGQARFEALQGAGAGRAGEAAADHDDPPAAPAPAPARRTAQRRQHAELQEIAPRPAEESSRSHGFTAPLRGIPRRDRRDLVFGEALGDMRSMIVPGRCSGAECQHRRGDPRRRPAGQTRHRRLDRGARRMAARARTRARRRFGARLALRRKAGTRQTDADTAARGPSSPVHRASCPRDLRISACPSDRGSSAASSGCACRSRRRSR